ncbi:MAG: hypothetical protein GWO08_02940 [Gammaproteobacteria bacterium]|nr:hypothetical protein [Gammaproteobacteria bacterium]NIR92646.1 hypothetical protein [Gammaproteobacteria bacterium]NIW44644.1 hypothetical protein [Gammaproteobacteria bacterium]
MEMFNVVLAVFWVIAGCVSFYFSIGNARVWTSIAVGFFLILLGEIIPGALPFLPGLNNPYVLAMGHIIGTISILVMSHGFQEYYVFTRTLEFEGNKVAVYLSVAGVIAASMVFLLINPEPDEGVRRVIRIVENTNWVFLSLINIDLIRKIYVNIKDTPISNGFVAFMAVFGCIFLWKGSQLYIDVFSLEQIRDAFPIRYEISFWCKNIGNFLASITVGGTFLYLGKLLR